jgi:flagellar FliL protein
MPERFNADDDLSLNIGEPDDDKPSGKKPPVRKILMAALIVLIVGGVAGTLMMLGKKSGPEPEPVEEMVEKQPIRPRTPAAFPTIVHLGSYEVQLGDLGGDRVFKVGIELETDSPDLSGELTRRSVQIRGMVTTLLGTKTLGEIQGTDGKIILKNELIANLNRMLETGKARNLYFSEFIIF